MSRDASLGLCKELLEAYPAPKNSEIWLTPSFLQIELVSQAAGGKLKVGAQNAHWAETGAFTGELSCQMLKECGAEYALVGHSERRHVFLESKEMCFKRAEAVLKSGLTLVFCIGETLSEREAGSTENVLAEQLSLLPSLCKSHSASKLVLAYEPVWAIGTGKVASVEEIENAHDFIQAYWEKNGAGELPPILYGGSVTADNVSAISNLGSVAGALIGGASNSFTSFSAIINKFEN